ncbi:MAG: ATP-binding protein [Treponemataceae bacterium]|nr:ATP-binding protein [Treponemataceae bacterium]
MDTRRLEEVISDQKQEIAKLMQKKFVERKEESLVDLNSNLAQVVIGVRRSGKSILCRNVLKKSGVHFAYVNFDDERLYSLTGDDLNDVLQILYKVYGEFEYLFIDEIQNISEWFLFVNRLLRNGMHILITGSNAKLLSGELATHLSGRHTQIELYPFSFSEYCDFFDVDRTSVATKETAFRRAAFDDYIKNGGFPEFIANPQNQTYINTLVKNILETDIKNRYKVRYTAVLTNLAQHIMNIAPSSINYTELQNLFSLKSVHTAENYAAFYKNAYIFVGLQKYSSKSKFRVTNEKFYCVDVVLMNRRENAFAGENLGWRLETLVYIELLRRYRPQMKDIYYYVDRSGEVDFVVCEQNRVEALYQVSYDISSEKTKKRELNALINGATKLNCKNLYLITDHERCFVNEKGYDIKICPAYDWMCGIE